jgi:hypothetical protein
MKLLLILGDGAVGKMTVGQELAKITSLRLFHNHMTIEPIVEIFGEYRPKTTIRLREVIFEDFAASNNYGMIFTYMMAFDLQSEWDYINHVANIFKKQGAEVFYAELFAPIETRINRNNTENRLKHKPTKRDIEKSNHFLLNHNHRCTSFDGEVAFANYIKIDNSNLAPETVAKMIKERFSLE